MLAGMCRSYSCVQAYVFGWKCISGRYRRICRNHQGWRRDLLCTMRTKRVLHKIAGIVAVFHYPNCVSSGSNFCDPCSRSKCQHGKCRSMPELQQGIRKWNSACGNCSIAMIWIALLTMLCLGLAHHLGLVEAIAAVVKKVSGCVKCSTMWVTLIVLLFLSCNVLEAIVLSILMAYLSYYWELALLTIDKFYQWLWGKVNKARNWVPWMIQDRKTWSLLLIRKSTNRFPNSREGVTIADYDG